VAFWDAPSGSKNVKAVTQRVQCLLKWKGIGPNWRHLTWNNSGKTSVLNNNAVRGSDLGASRAARCVSEISNSIHYETTQHYTGWPQSRRKKFPDFSRLFQSHKLTLPQVIAANSKCNNDLRQGQGRYSEILMIPFTQSTAVLHKYLND